MEKQLNEHKLALELAHYFAQVQFARSHNSVPWKEENKVEKTLIAKINPTSPNINN